MTITLKQLHVVAESGATSAPPAPTRSATSGRFMSTFDRRAGLGHGRDGALRHVRVFRRARRGHRQRRGHHRERRQEHGEGRLADRRGPPPEPGQGGDSLRSVRYDLRQPPPRPGRDTKEHTSGTETDEALAVSEERLRVGMESRESAPARLRKYVVTENVTKTVPVRREEVRLERVPLTDANVCAASRGGHQRGGAGGGLALGPRGRKMSWPPSASGLLGRRPPAARACPARSARYMSW